MRVPFAPSSRILAFQLHSGCSGQCALDGFGLAPHGWTISRRATRSFETLERFLSRSIQRFRPSTIVLSVSRRTAPADEALRVHALTFLRSFRLPVVQRSVRDAYMLLRGRIRGAHRNELARTIAVNFLPELRDQLSLSQVRDHRSAWHALAVALVELVHRFPRSAAALATSRAFSIPQFRTALMKAESIRHPDPL